MSGTTIEHFLVGDDKILVETNNDEYEFEHQNNKVQADVDEVPDEIIVEANERGFFFESIYPKETTIYAHDEATERDIDKVKDELDISDDKTARNIANTTYEIPIKVKLYEDRWEITEIKNKELQNPIAKKR